MEKLKDSEYKKLINLCFEASEIYFHENLDTNDFFQRIDRPYEYAMQLMRLPQTYDWIEQYRQKVPESKIVEEIKKVLVAEKRKEQFEKDFTATEETKGGV